MSATSQFPRQDIPLHKKVQKDGNLVPSWGKQHLDYADSLLQTYSPVREAMTKWYNSYNGIKSDKAKQHIERVYGKINRKKFISYRLGRTKLSLLHGEFLKRPLSATVETINSEAKSAKMEQISLMKGAMVAKKELEDLKNIAGVDVMEGAQIPENEDDPIWSKMSFKDKQEDIMQIICDEQIKTLNVKNKLSVCFLDLLVTSMCYGKTEVDETGEVNFNRIDPRDAIYEFIEGDDFLQRSSVKGCRSTVTIHEILMKYNLNEEQRNQIDNIRQNPNEYIGLNGKSNGRITPMNGTLVCDVVHIEWLSVEPEYYKISPKTNAQMMIDDSTDNVKILMDAESYEKNVEIHNKNIAAGKYTIEVKWKQVVYEATRIGGVIDVNMRRKPFQPHDLDNPSKVLSTSYHGYICGTLSGVRVSLQEMIQNFDELYDMLMYQINKDVARAKGKALFYDRAGAPEGKTIEKILYQIVNDGFIDYNSAAAGNLAQRNLSDLTSAIKEIDLGLSQSFLYLVDMKNNLVQDLNQITGINENREGQVAASATVSNTNSAIQASRTITEPLFYGMNLFTQMVVQSIVDVSAISWAFYKVEKGEQILGASKHRFLQVTKELGYRNYGVHVEDGSKYAEIRQRMNALAEFSLNAKEIRPMDVLKLQLAETTAQMKTILENSWIEMQKNIQMQNEQNNQANAQVEQMRQQTMLQISREDREDRQNATKEDIVLSGDVQQQIDNNKAKNKMFENQMKSENDIINQ